MSDDLISRQAAIDEIARWIGYIDEDMILRIQTGLKKLPSAQPERKKGEWIWVDGVRCSNCNHKLQTTGLPSVCPNCGAQMDERKEDD